MRRAHTLTAIAITLLLAVGCSSATKAPPSSRVAPPPPAETTTIRLGAMHGMAWILSDLLIPAFQSEYAQYQVELVTFEKMDQLQKAAQNGQVDVISMPWADRRNVLSMAKPLDPYLTKSGIDMAPYGSLMDDLRVGGRTYDLPYSVSLGLLLYNVEKVKAAGVTIPADAWTWDEFRAVVAKLPEGEGKTKVWGLETIFHEDLLRLWLEGTTGRPLWEADLKSLREGIGLFHTMIFTDQAMVPAPPYQISSGGLAFNYSRYRLGSLMNGEAAMTFEERVDAWDFARLELDWAVAPMPAAPGKRPVLPVYPRSLGMAAGTTKPDAAWDFIAFAAGPEGAAVLARAGQPPAYRGDQVRQAWAEHQPAYPAGMESIWAANWKVIDEERPAGTQVDLRWTEFKKAQNWALSGQKSIDDALGWFVANERGQ